MRHINIGFHIASGKWLTSRGPSYVQLWHLGVSHLSPPQSGGLDLGFPLKPLLKRVAIQRQTQLCSGRRSLNYSHEGPDRGGVGLLRDCAAAHGQRGAREIWAMNAMGQKKGFGPSRWLVVFWVSLHPKKGVLTRHTEYPLSCLAKLNSQGGKGTQRCHSLAVWVDHG